MEGITRVRSGKYLARVKHLGKVRKRTFSTAALAEIWRANQRIDHERAIAGAPRIQRTTLATFIEKVYQPWADKRKREGTLRNDRTYQRHLLPIFGRHLLQEISREAVVKYQHDRLACVKSPTINREVSYLRAVLSHAVYTGALVTNPLYRVSMLPESPERRPVLSRASETALLEACHPSIVPYVRWAIGTGMRRSEAIALTWADVDTGHGVVVVQDSKTGKSREVILTRQMRLLLDEIGRGLPAAPVLPVIHGDTLTHRFEVAAKKAGLALRFHDLRHVFASRMLAAGANLVEVASQTGHSDMTMARRYSHATKERVRDIMDRASDLDLV